MNIGSLNRKVLLCSASDVKEGGTLLLIREGVRGVFCNIAPSSSSGVLWAASGRNVEDQPTHKITMRAMPDLEITRTAWLYEDRRISAPLWYKVLQVQETENGQWWIFRARLDSRSDKVSPIQKGSGLARPAGNR